MQEKSQPLDGQPEFVFNSLRQVLLTVTALYPTATPQHSLRLPPLTDRIAKKHSVLNQLQKHFRAHQKLFIDVVLHGSAATNEIVSNWSDIDIIAIVRQGVVNETPAFLTARACLRQAEKMLYKFDPWQHHGIQVITEADLRFYPEFFLPLVVLRHGVSLIRRRPRQLTFFIRDSSNESRERFKQTVQLLHTANRHGELRHHGKGGVYLKENFKNANQTFYQFKYFTSVILLLPSLFLEVLEGPVLKKESFARLTSYSTERELELVRACEKVRLLAPQEKMSGGAVPPTMQNTLGANYFKRAARLARHLWHIYEVQ